MAKEMTTTFVTRTADRWDLLAQDIYNLSSLGWAIAEANPLLAGVLILDGGITINIPAIETLRQPLVSVNPARADTSTGFITPPGTASPTPPPTPTPSAVVFPIAISQGGTGAINNSQALTNLGAIATNQIGVTVTPLVNSLVPINNLPPYPTLISLDGVSNASFNSALNAISTALSTKLDTATYNTGIALKLDTATYNTEIALKLNSSAKNTAGGVAGLDANSFISTAQIPLSTFFPFTGGAGFKGGGSPGLATNTQAGVDSSGFPRFWLVNGSAPANSRIKSITVAANGNLQFRHHNDDLSDGNVLEHTASGNALTNGTFRPGSGATAFTGASFVPGAIYFRTDVLGDSGVGCLTYSDGAVWRRISDGTLVTSADIKQIVLTGTSASTQGGLSSIPHNLNGSKILGWTIKIAQIPGTGVEGNFNTLNGYEYTCYHDSTVFGVTNVMGNSASILSRPIIIVVSYTS